LLLLDLLSTVYAIYIFCLIKDVYFGEKHIQFEYMVYKLYSEKMFVNKYVHIVLSPL